MRIGCFPLKRDLLTLAMKKRNNVIQLRNKHANGNEESIGHRPGMVRNARHE